MDFNRANDFEGTFYVEKDRAPVSRSRLREIELIISRIRSLERWKGILTEGSVVSANVVAGSELRSEGGFSDFRRAQHAYFVSRHPLAAAFLPRFHVGELRGRTKKSEREKERNETPT